MSSLIFLSLLFLSYTSADIEPPPSTPSPVAAPPAIIQQACKATRFPESCQTTLAEPGRLGPKPTPVQVIQAALKVSSDNLHKANTMVESIAKSSGDSLNRTKATKNCQELLRYSDYRISLANSALPSGKKKDARAWMSAALLYQYDCWSALKYANDTQLVNQTMSFVNSLTELSSNALSMMMSYDDNGDDMSTWTPPKTERDGFWGRGSDCGSELGSRGGFPSKLTVDVKVCKDGKDGCYKTVQEAVNAAPNLGVKRFVIHIMAGVYEETVRVPLEKKNVVFLGDGIGKTVITGSLNAGLLGVTTYDSATVGVVGDGFMASGITFQNKGGVDAHQAVAFRSDSDRSVIENCEFLGNQDTLYAHSLRQFYKSCRIQGNVDFIFGNSASIFQDCHILIAPRQADPEKGEKNAVTAHGRKDPAQSTGFVFQNCSINGTEEYVRLYKSNSTLHINFLGRPWKEYSRTVFIRCNMEQLITAQGWMEWDADFALKTLFYGEFQNTGPGSDLSQRVPWSSRIPAEHANTYSVQNFIQGYDWIPRN
ncbi:probable pectinesterase/pectinesterase inhibitor 51 [Humulus lupulus]|uniref:probable pectinesterase/pectinesterase inhibitor 51 n=1 Tax=Humulus lupulus TaxID=3486 RepID=UPI002B416E74|nr:probable pectinesterase/pectinesterase inhibitor 51 [Humulus lupulus]